MTENLQPVKGSYGDSDEPTVEIPMRIISKRSELKGMAGDRSVKSVHMAFRPSNIDLLTAVKKFPNVQLVQLPKSYRDTLAKSMEMYLADQNIMLIVGDVWGHRKDISEWVSIKIPTTMLDEARSKLNDSVG